LIEEKNRKEKMKQEKLMSLSVPEVIPTKAAELIMEKRIQEKEEQKKLEMKLKRDKELKERAHREAAAVMKVQISEVINALK
jgi:hypothetical protein